MLLTCAAVLAPSIAASVAVTSPAAASVPTIDVYVGDASVVEAEETRDGTQRRRLAGAVGAKERDDLPGLDRKRYPLHGRDRALINDFELFDGEQRAGHRPEPRAWRWRNGHSRK